MNLEYDFFIRPLTLVLYSILLSLLGLMLFKSNGNCGCHIKSNFSKNAELLLFSAGLLSFFFSLFRFFV